MKKSFLFIIVIVLYSANAYAKNLYFCQQTGTKPWGCDHKDEKPPAPNGSGGSTYQLYCIGEGSITCQFSDGTCPLVVSQAIEAIESQIAGGALDGNIVTDWGSYNWQATDNENYEYTVELNDVE